MNTKPRWIIYCEHTMAIMLAVMVVLVFGNVVLRYGFNSGIVVSEEASRFLFVWLTFIGAIVAMRENTHLGVDSLVRMVGLTGKKVLYSLSNVLMLICCAMLFWGSYKQTVINWTVPSAAMEVPMALLYGIAMIAALGIGFILASNLYKLLTGTLPEEALVQTSDSEETLHEDTDPAHNASNTTRSQA